MKNQDRKFWLIISVNIALALVLYFFFPNVWNFLIDHGRR